MAIYEIFLPEISDVNLIMRKQLGESRMPNIWPCFLKGVNIMKNRKTTRANSTLKDTNQKDVTAKCNMWTLNGSRIEGYSEDNWGYLNMLDDTTK